MLRFLFFQHHVSLHRNQASGNCCLQCRRELRPLVLCATHCKVSMIKYIFTECFYALFSVADEATFQLVSALCFTFSQNVRNPEAVYRTLVALGTLGVVQPQVRSLANDLDVKSFLARTPKGKLDKLDQVIAEAKNVFL